MSGIESKVKFNHQIAEQESVRPSYNPGQHALICTSADRQMSKEKPEARGVQYKMIKVNLKSLRDPEDTTSVVGRGIQSFQCLPFWDEAWDELDYETNTKNDGAMHIKKVLERNMTIFAESVRDLLAALLPDEVPARPYKMEDGSYIYKGEAISAEDYKACNTESKTLAGEVAERLWNEGPDELVGHGCFGLIIQPEGSAFAELKRVGSEQLIDFKTREPIPMVEKIMASAAEVEGEEDEEPISKSNGAKGKPSASKATVAAASKAKGKTPVKNARR